MTLYDGPDRRQAEFAETRARVEEMTEVFADLKAGPFLKKIWLNGFKTGMQRAQTIYSRREATPNE